MRERPFWDARGQTYAPGIANRSSTRRGAARRALRAAMTVLLALLMQVAAAVSLGSGAVSTAVNAYAAGAYFPTLAPGSALPSDADCAARVRRNGWEPRPQNAQANHNAVSAHLPAGGDELVYVSRVTGNFTGTTDEIIQWGACKWGLDENVVRAQAVQESDWVQSTAGDCRGSSVPAAHGCQSWGLLQIKGTNDPPDYPGTFPTSRDSTAFAVDYALATRRACFDGKISWAGGGYGAGHLWSCVGFWYSGQWGSYGSYLSEVQGHYNAQDWNRYPGGPAPTPAQPSGYNPDNGSGAPNPPAATGAVTHATPAPTPRPAPKPAATPTATPAPPSPTPTLLPAPPPVTTDSPTPVPAPPHRTKHSSSKHHSRFPLPPPLETWLEGLLNSGFWQRHGGA